MGEWRSSSTVHLAAASTFTISAYKTSGNGSDQMRVVSIAPSMTATLCTWVFCGVLFCCMQNHFGSCVPDKYFYCSVFRSCKGQTFPQLRVIWCQVKVSCSCKKRSVSFSVQLQRSLLSPSLLPACPVIFSRGAFLGNYLTSASAYELQCHGCFCQRSCSTKAIQDKATGPGVDRNI